MRGRKASSLTISPLAAVSSHQKLELGWQDGSVGSGVCCQA